jgi:Holliday junction resolvase-like predicted endonuclease
MFGLGIEKISTSKAQRLQTTVLRYLEKTGDFEVDWRIELLSIQMTNSGQALRVDYIQQSIEE